jgi:hypothetical protein
VSLLGAAVSLAATTIGVAFTALVFRQWIAHRKEYQLAWSAGLGLFTVAIFSQFWAEAFGWSDVVYKAYYLMAAPLVAVLGVGSAFLISRRLGLGFSLYTAIASVLFAIIVAGATVDTSVFAQPIVTANAMPESVRLWSLLFTIPGSAALIVVALYSYYRTRLSFNLWIAAGFIVAASGGAFERFNVTLALYLGQLFGIALLFWGFLKSQDISRAPKPIAEKAAS